jgi:hypothetical protein
MTNSIEPARRPVIPHLLPNAARPARRLIHRLTALATWARLTNTALRLGEADVVSPLDAQSRHLLWHALTETVSTIGVLAPADSPPQSGLAALARLADRLRERVANETPRVASFTNPAEPPQLFLLEILIHDLQPCLGRWRPRLDAWSRSQSQAADWPLLGLCRADLARTRERLIERGWQIGIYLEVPGLGRLLPERPAVVPEMVAPHELVSAEAAVIAPPDPAEIEAGWHIYLDAVTRLPAQDPPSGPGALGEAIDGLDTLAGEIRAALKSMPSPRSNSGATTIPALALALLNKGLAPFLTEWRPRYRRFLASERSETKWRHVEECRAALTATRDRCLPTVEEIGRKVGAPPLPAPVTPLAPGDEEPRLQLPPPIQGS